MMNNMQYMSAMVEKKDCEYDTYKKLWNEDCESKKERLKYWNKFDQYFRKGIELMNCKENDFADFCEYLNEHDNLDIKTL